MGPNHILVLGDAMIDVHLFGTSHRLSPEAPIPIVEVEDEKDTLGGAANVAAHIASYQIPCLFAYKSAPAKMIFDDDHRDLYTMLCNHNIIPIRLSHTENHVVTVKKRIWTNGQQVCRIDEEHKTPPDAITENNWYKQIIELFDKYNISIVICSDYNKGTLTDNLLNMVASFCAEINVPIILDPKRPSFHKLKNFTIIKPNRKELFATNMPAHKCSTILNDTYLVHTLGADGVAIWQNGHCVFSAPTETHEVIDVCGAGDSFNALLGISLYYGLNINQAVMAANRSASYTIRHRGCYCLTAEEINESLDYGRA